MKVIVNIIKTMRVKQWAKNMFVFMPLIFSGKLLSYTALSRSFYAFLVFCVTASGIYIINDITDKKKDRLHSRKKTRPIAAGHLNVKPAVIASIIILTITLLVSLKLNFGLFAVISLYIFLHLLYSFGIKKAVILDVIVLAVGFELRVWAGSLIINIIPSIWLQLCVFVLAIFLGLLKRRHEKISLYSKAPDHRNVLTHYKVYFLDQMSIIAATLCIVFYGLYTVSSDITSRIGSTNMAYTIPFVIYGIFRYLYIIHTKKVGGDPGEVMLSDIPLLINMVLWITVAGFFIYTPQ